MRFGKIIAASLVTLTAVAIGCSRIPDAVSFLSSDRVAYGVSLSGVPLSGMEEAAARDEVRRLAALRLSPSVAVFEKDGRVWELSGEEAGLSIDEAATLRDVMGIGRGGGFLDNVVEAARCAIDGREASFVASVDEERLKESLGRIAADLRVEPKDAWCSLGPDGVELHPGQNGKTLDTNALSEMIKGEMLSLNIPYRADIELIDILPSITDADIAPIDSVIGTCTTYYAAGGNRGENIRIAADSLNGAFIKSGADFSFNDTVGERVADAGYLSAPVIVSGRVEPGIGGGVCQVSSTLYNSVLLANLTPTERSPHTYPSHYIKAGLDATVADGLIDMKFKNNLPHGVSLVAGAYGGELTIHVLGHAADIPGDVSLETKIVGSNPTVKVWRVLKKDGSEISREFLHTDDYSVVPSEPEPPAPKRSTSPATAPDKPAPEKPTAEKPSAPESAPQAAETAPASTSRARSVPGTAA